MEGWKRLTCQKDGKNLLMNFNATDKKSYEIRISDLDNVWQEALNAIEMEDRCKQLNPRLEVSLASILEHIQNALESEEMKILSVAANHDFPNQVKLEMHNDFMGGIPFRWEFSCSKSNDEQCHNVFLLPIARLIMSLQVANNQLIDIIHKKDDEIKDYKEFSGATVSRPYLETQQFDIETFSEKLRRSVEYQNAINKDIMSILTSKSVNDKVVELEKDISNPLSILGSDTKDRTAPAKIKGRTRNRRKNVRAPAKGAEIESDQDDSSQEQVTQPRVVFKRASTTATSKIAKKKKSTGKRKKLF